MNYKAYYQQATAYKRHTTEESSPPHNSRGIESKKSSRKHTGTKLENHPEQPLEHGDSLASRMNTMNVDDMFTSPKKRVVRFADEGSGPSGQVTLDNEAASEKPHLSDSETEDAATKAKREREWQRQEESNESLHLTATTVAMKKKFAKYYPSSDDDEATIRAMEQARMELATKSRAESVRRKRIESTKGNNWAAQDRKENGIEETGFAYPYGSGIRKDSRRSKS